MRRGIPINTRMMHYLIIACTMAVVALFWSPTTCLSGEKALDTAMIERLAGVKGELSEKERSVQRQCAAKRPRHHCGRCEDDAAAGADLVGGVSEGWGAGHGHGRY